MSDQDELSGEDAAEREALDRLRASLATEVDETSQEDGFSPQWRETRGALLAKVESGELSESTLEKVDRLDELDRQSVQRTLPMDKAALDKGERPPSELRRERLEAEEREKKEAYERKRAEEEAEGERFLALLTPRQRAALDRDIYARIRYAHDRRNGSSHNEAWSAAWAKHEHGRPPRFYDHGPASIALGLLVTVAMIGGLLLVLMLLGGSDSNDEPVDGPEQCYGMGGASIEC